MRDSVTFYLNGVKKTIQGSDLFLNLSSYLRYNNQLTGTKVVCAEGDCGACSVMIAKWNPLGPKNHYVSINSCIAKVFMLDGANLVTVEGLNEKNSCCEIQKSMVRNFSSQCGFCTPGFVVSMTNMFEHKSHEQIPFTAQSVKNYLTGNLCRCTGYSSIIDAALDVNIKEHQLVKDRYPQKDLSEELKMGLHIATNECEVFAPMTISEACTYKSENPDVIIFSGSTDLGVQINKGFIEPQKILSLHLIPELYERKIENGFVSVGARVTLAELQELVREEIPSMDSFFNIFASPQIKNSATLVGNVANASPIADSVPMLMALDAEVHICGKNSQSVMPIKDFYLGYKKLNLQKDELITKVRFKVPGSDHVFKNYKVSQRRDLDISTINASFNFEIKNKKIESARIVYGGVAATTLRLYDIEKSLAGKTVNEASVNEIKTLIINSIQPLSDVRGTADYRKTLAANIFEKFAKEHLQL